MKRFLKLSTYLKFSLIAFCFCAFLSSIGSISNKTINNKAYACACGLFCTQSGNGVQSAMVSIYDDIVNNLQEKFDDLVVQWWDRLNANGDSYETEVLAKIDTTTESILTWLNTWYWYDVKPVTQDITAQNVAMVIDQTRNIGSFYDASMQVKAYEQLQTMDYEAHKRYRASENICVVGTSSSGFTRSNLIRRAMNSAMPVEQFSESLNTAGTASADGNDPYIVELWADYKARYCDVMSNNGDDDATNYNFGSAGCTVNGTYVDQDIMVSHMIFDRPTLNITDAEYKTNLDHLVRNIVTPNVPNPISLDLLNSEAGRSTYLGRRTDSTRRNVALEAISHILSRRMPGSDQDVYNDEILEFAGVSAADYGLSDNPSYEELMNTFIRDRFRNGHYQNFLIDSPESNLRERTVLEGFKFMQHHDSLDLMDRMNLLLASQVAILVNNE